MNRPVSVLFHPIVCIAGLLLVSCATQPEPAPVASKPQKVLYQWEDPGGPQPLRVQIDLGRQIATFERGNRVVGWTYVATGKPGHETPVGDFRVLQKKADKTSNRYGLIENAAGDVVSYDATSTDSLKPGEKFVPAPMPDWMRITWTGIGMHGGYIPHPGRPASHGCIRMPKSFVPKLYKAVRIGTPVTVRETFPPQLDKKGLWPFDW